LGRVAGISDDRRSGSAGCWPADQGDIKVALGRLPRSLSCLSTSGQVCCGQGQQESSGSLEWSSDSRSAGLLAARGQHQVGSAGGGQKGSSRVCCKARQRRSIGSAAGKQRRSISSGSTMPASASPSVMAQSQLVSFITAIVAQCQPRSLIMVTLMGRLVVRRQYVASVEFAARRGSDWSGLLQAD
jgi:hypothetical protein